MSTSDYSRRALVTTAAVTALVPAIPVMAAAGALPVGADAELLQLGAQLMAIERRIKDLDRRVENLPDDHTDDDMNALLDVRCDVVPKILALTATTRAGVAVQVAACIAGCEDIWL